jgi:hypothetical protein
LVVRENADRDFQPDLLVDSAWERVREFFIEQTHIFGKTWLDDQE